RLTNVSGKMQRMLTAAERVLSLIEQLPEKNEGTKQLQAPAKGHVEFSGITHRFPGAQSDTLHDINLTVEPGQTVALVGRSGSGKTTLVNILPRFIEPDSVVVRVDGLELHDISLRSLRSQLSLVSQDVVLFEGTIRENVAYGALGDVSDQQIFSALEAADLSSFVESLPNGLDTPVGENAGN